MMMRQDIATYESKSDETLGITWFCEKVKALINQK